MRRPIPSSGPVGARRTALAAILLTGLASPGTAQDPADWRTWAGAAAAFGGLLLLDDPVRDAALDLRGGTADHVASFGRWYGDWSETAPLLAGGLLAIGTLTEGGAGARRAAAVVAGALAGSMTNEALNQAIGRSRPAEGYGSWHFDAFAGHASLGSGHAAYAFALAGAIDEVTEGSVALPFYGAAAVTALSRVYHDRHWLSDVAFGGLLGLWMGRTATRKAVRALGVERTPREAATGSGGLLARLEPVIGGGALGLRLTF